MRIKITSCIICLTLLMGLAGCGAQDSSQKTAAPSKKTSDTSSLADDVASENEQKKPLAAICMPSQSDERWIDAAAAINTNLTDAGFQVQIEFAEDDAQKQIRQLEGFLEQKAACLIVAPVPSADLSDTLAKAQKAKIPVIAYERLLMSMEAVDYYVGFDNLEAGRQIGEYIVQEKDLDASGSKERSAPSYTIEFFAGDPQDLSAKMVHQGILEILQPYLDSGRLVCKSGRVTFEDTAILYESQETAQRNCEALLDANHLDGHLDIACTTSDTLARGVRTALENRGYTQGKDWPLITGQDAQLEAVEEIKAGYQSMSVFRNTRTLAAKCAEMATDCLNGKKPETNDQKEYTIGKKTIPAYLCKTHAVDKENYKEVLVDSGHYTESQLK